FFARWAGFQAKSINASQRLGVLTNLLNAVPATLSTFNTTVILTVGGLAVMEGRLSLGLLVGFQGLMSSFLAPINNLVNLGSRLQTAQAQMTQVNDVLDNPADPTTQRTSSVSSARPSVHRLQGRLEL